MMRFKEIIEKNYTDRTSFVGDNKVYFMQRDDIDKAIWSKIETELKANGFEIKQANPTFDSDDDRKHFPFIEVKPKTNENKIPKMKKSEAYSYIKEQIKSSLLEKKKGKKDEEEVSSETIPTDDSIAPPTPEVDPNIKAIQTHLTKAQEAANTLGDQKLITQIGNSLTYFTRAHISNTEVNESKEALKNDDVIYDTLNNMDLEHLASMIIAAAEDNPSLTLKDFLEKEFGETED